MVALTHGGPGISTTFPANYVYDLMFQRGQIGEGAAAAIMMLAALAVVLVPYALYLVWRKHQEQQRMADVVFLRRRSVPRGTQPPCSRAIAIYGLLILFALVYMMPLVVVVMNSFRDNAEVGAKRPD